MLTLTLCVHSCSQKYHQVHVVVSLLQTVLQNGQNVTELKPATIILFPPPLVPRMVCRPEQALKRTQFISSWHHLQEPVHRVWTGKSTIHLDDYCNGVGPGLPHPHGWNGGWLISQSVVKDKPQMKAQESMQLSPN